MADLDTQHDRSPTISHPLYSTLLSLLAGKTLFPISLVQFRDQFLPLHDASGVLGTYMQFHQWYSTFRGYFASLTEAQKARCLPPSQCSQDEVLYSLDPLPYRTEVDCALAHYLPAGKFPNELRQQVLNDAKVTTHPDVFLPLVHYLHEQLLQPFEVFIKCTANNVSPASRKLRLLVSGMALIMGVAVIAFCVVMKVQRWWRIIPLPWMSIALFYLTSAAYGMDPLRYWFGLTFVNIVALWTEGSGDVEKGGLLGGERVAVVMDDQVKAEQARRMRMVYVMTALGVLVFWGVGLALP